MRRFEGVRQPQASLRALLRASAGRKGSQRRGLRGRALSPDALCGESLHLSAPSSEADRVPCQDTCVRWIYYLTVCQTNTYFGSLHQKSSQSSNRQESKGFTQHVRLSAEPHQPARLTVFVGAKAQEIVTRLGKIATPSGNIYFLHILEIIHIPCAWTAYLAITLSRQFLACLPGVYHAVWQSVSSILAS